MTPPTTSFALVNNTGSSNAWAYINGLDLNNNNTPIFVQSDGKTVYSPQSPSAEQSPLAADVAISLGSPGATTSVTVPRIAGGRIWFAVDAKLTFLLNPGPAVVEPAVTNKADPNYNVNWGFAEFTFNAEQLFVNISYVDFVALPIAIKLRNASGQEQSVQGLPDGGVDKVASALAAQAASDGAGWDRLVVKAGDGGNGANLRVLSPNAGRVADPSLFEGYYAAHVDAVWAKYAAEDLTINTQASWGDVVGRVKDGDLLTFPQGSFAKPSAADVFSCSTGPFGNYPEGADHDAMGAIGARLAAALNRSTLLRNARQPDGEVVETYYAEPVTNHYARAVHAASADGRGYAFPYDDVVPSGSDQPDPAGTAFDPNPELLTVTVGKLRAASSASGDGGEKKEEEGEGRGGGE